MVYKLPLICLYDLLTSIPFQNNFIWCSLIDRPDHRLIHNDIFDVSLNKPVSVATFLEGLLFLSPSLYHLSYISLYSRGCKTLWSTLEMCYSSDQAHHFKNSRNQMRVLVLLVTHLGFISCYFKYLLHHLSIKWE